jgi:hypothetical protein
MVENKAREQSAVNASGFGEFTSWLESSSQNAKEASRFQAAL